MKISFCTFDINLNSAVEFLRSGKQSEIVVAEFALPQNAKQALPLQKWIFCECFN